MCEPQWAENTFQLLFYRRRSENLRLEYLTSSQNTESGKVKSLKHDRSAANIDK